MNFTKILHLLLTVLLLLLDQYCGQVKANAIISPPERASACIGGQLELTCTVMGNFLEWNINISSTGDEPYSRILSRFSETMGFRLNSTQFTFSRVSPQGSSPLESVLLISPISRYLNGTVVNCTDRTSGKISSTIIKIITDLHHQLNITLLSEEFESDGAIVALEWTHQNSYLYNVSVTPLLELMYSDVTRITFNVSYNIIYNISISTSPPCGLNTATIVLYYVSCDNPTNLIDNSSEIRITNYRAPALEGTRIQFDCPRGPLSGPNSSTCMGNGEWEPTPREVECKAMQMDMKGAGSLGQSVQIIIASVTVCVVSSSLFFALGLLCYHYCLRQKHHDQESIPPTTTEKEELNKQNLMYHGQVELTENVAYVSVHL